MNSLLERLVGPSVREKVWRLLEAPQRRKFQRALEARPHRLPRGGPALSYGAALGSDALGLVHGGRVKLLHLAAAFPELPDFNLLYLVSSAPPKFAPELVQWARAQGAKLVWNQNGVAYPAWYGARCEKINGPMRTLRAQADFIFYQSEFCRDCAARYLGPSDTPGEIAYNSVDIGHFLPGAAPERGVCRLLAAGSHHESYRVVSVLETVAELIRRKFPVRLHLAGRLMWTGAEGEIAARIAALKIGDHVERSPAYRQEEAPAIYRAAHILLHPKYKDPCPTVPIEAMACGVPVIASASGGMPELVGPGAGELLAVPESWTENHWPTPVAMADAVETIMAGWGQYREAARDHAAAKFSKDNWVAQHRRVFQMLAPA